MMVRIGEFERDIEVDEYADYSYLEQEGFEERLRLYRDLHFHFVGVRAKVELMIPHGDVFIAQTLTSPGLWGIESDSGEEYFEQVFQDECEILKSMIEELRKPTTEGGA